MFIRYPSGESVGDWPTLRRLALSVTRLQLRRRKQSIAAYYVNLATMLALEADLNAWALAHHGSMVGVIRDGRSGWYVRGVPVFCR